MAGEPSGDERAAEVVSELSTVHPQLRFFGMGGDALRKAGAEIVIDIANTAVFGVLEALTQINKFHHIMATLLAECEKRDALEALLVDFGGFNLRLAAKLKQRGGRVAYYISPQVWASRAGRVRKVKSHVDLMMVLFDFEVEFYKRHDVDAVHVGHPLVDTVRTDIDVNEMRERLGFELNKPLIGLLPGSRNSELQRLLPVMLDAVGLLQQRGIRQFLLPAAAGKADYLRKTLADREIQIVTSDKYNALAACDAAMITSGTAALEAAILGVPSVVIYKTSWVTALAARFLMKVKHVSLPNIILSEEVFPELLQSNCMPERLAGEIAAIVEDRAEYDRIRALLSGLGRHLGKGGAAVNAAREIERFLGLS